MSEAGKEIDLPSLRSRINSIDKQLVELICQRGQIVKQVGLAKRNSNTAVYAPDRERQVIERAVRNNTGPLSNLTIEAVFRELMSGSIRLQLPLRVSYLGPKGSFSHLAAIRHFGSSVELGEMKSIDAVVQSVDRGHYDHGIIPFENSTGGSIKDTLDALLKANAKICAEALLGVSLNLVGNCSPAEVKSIHSKPQVFAQCRNWIENNFPQATLVAEASTTAAAQHATKYAEKGAVAIASSLASDLYGLKVLFSSIEDRTNNITRFVIISRTSSTKPSGYDRTTINFDIKNGAGTLQEVLKAFAHQHVNLLSIDKCPHGEEDWCYSFFIDVEGHRSDPRVQLALDIAREKCSKFRVVGSYPRARRVYRSSL